MLLKGQLVREDHMKCFTLLRKQKTENRVAVIVKDFVKAKHHGLVLIYIFAFDSQNKRNFYYILTNLLIFTNVALLVLKNHKSKKNRLNKQCPICQSKISMGLLIG